MQETPVLGSIPGLERSPEGDMANCSSILAWEIPWTEEPGAAKSWTRPRARAHVSFEGEKCPLVRCPGLHPTLQATCHPGRLAFPVAPRLPGAPSTASRMKCPQGEQFWMIIRSVGSSANWPRPNHPFQTVLCLCLILQTSFK